MLNDFISTLVYEIAKSLSAKNRNDDTKLPKTIMNYLEKKDTNEILHDLKIAVEFIKNPSKTAILGNDLMIAIATFFAQTFSGDLYKLPIEFFNTTYEKQAGLVKHIIKSNSRLGEALRRILTDNNYQQIYEGLADFIVKATGSPYIVVQTASELSSKTYEQIKNKLSESLDKMCFPVFNINASLIGGLRVFIDGKVNDFSWLCRINYITNLKT